MLGYARNNHVDTLATKRLPRVVLNIRCRDSVSRKTSNEPKYCENIMKTRGESIRQVSGQADVNQQSHGLVGHPKMPKTQQNIDHHPRTSPQEKTVRERAKWWAGWPTLGPAGHLFLQTRQNLAAKALTGYMEAREMSLQSVGPRKWPADHVVETWLKRLL
jgi:hypothetical protein